MKMMMLLLVSALVLLVSPALTTPTTHHHRTSENNLNHLFDLADKYNRSLAQAFFVEDVSHLAEGRNKCEDKFFCKVHQILDTFGKKHDIAGRKREEELVRNLQTYVDSRNITCAELLKDVVPSGNTKPIPELIGHLTQCIQSRNLNGAPQDL